MSQLPSDAARALAAARKKEPKVCARCGREFMGFRWAKYCGAVCVSAVYRARNREDLNRKRREKYARQKGIQPPVPMSEGEG